MLAYMDSDRNYKHHLNLAYNQQNLFYHFALFPHY